MKNLILYLCALAVIVAAGTAFALGLADKKETAAPALPGIERTVRSVVEKAVEGSKRATELRTVGAFSRLELRGAGDAVLVPGAGESVEIEADDPASVVAEVHGGVLVLDRKPGAGFGEGPRYRVPAGTLVSVSTSGAGNVRAEPVLSAPKLELSVGGSGSIEMELQAKELACAVNGSGALRLKGRADSVRLDLRGSGDLRAKELSGDDAKVNIAGSGSADIGVFKTLGASVAGSGRVRYAGTPRVNASVAGSGSVEARD